MVECWWHPILPNCWVCESLTAQALCQVWSLPEPKFCSLGFGFPQSRNGVRSSSELQANSFLLGRVYNAGSSLVSSSPQSLLLPPLPLLWVHLSLARLLGQVGNQVPHQSPQSLEFRNAGGLEIGSLPPPCSLSLKLPRNYTQMPVQEFWTSW